ncbi:kelch-like protein 38 [Dysidea avara]|uniref:kelch-like protein 38 n=1 Tax=Dysidea avara TaxID=196820 RepID=UPI003318E42F
MEGKRKNERTPSSSGSKRICLRNSMGFAHDSSTLYRLPSDITLKLSDGSIDAHKVILASVSPVFESMFYGGFKEKKSNKVDLPIESYKTMKLLIDAVYKGSCELDSLDDMIPLMEVVDRYQINKAPLQHMCGEAVLSQLDLSNYSTLLSKYASLMSEESNKKAANKVVTIIGGDLESYYEEVCELPEEVMLPLLQESNIDCSESFLFEFLVDWYKYQTEKLGTSLQLVSQLFQCIRYSLIVPQILSSKVVSCSQVDKQLLSIAYRYIYTSCKPLGVYAGDDDDEELVEHTSKKPVHSLKIEWFGYDGVSTTYNQADKCKVTFNTKKVPLSKYIMKSSPLKDGIYTFSVSNFTAQVPFNRDTSSLL